jgi:hypothetical protein
MRDQGIPNKQCQIHNSFEVAASSTIVGLRWWAVYILCQEAGLFHLKCMQSTLLSIPNHPPFALCIINLSVSSSLGSWWYLAPKTQMKRWQTSTHTLELGIFSNADIFIDLIKRNAICNYSHCVQCFSYGLNPMRSALFPQRVKKRKFASQASTVWRNSSLCIW